MKFWKEHTALRVSLIALLFIAGLALVVGGWSMTGQMSGLIIMIVGLVLLSRVMEMMYSFQKERKLKRMMVTMEGWAMGKMMRTMVEP